MRHCSPRWPRLALPWHVAGGLQRFAPALPTRMEDAFRVRLTFHPRRDLALRYAKGSAPAPVAHTAQQGNRNRQKRTHAWIKLGGNVDVDDIVRTISGVILAAGQFCSAMQRSALNLK